MEKHTSRCLNSQVLVDLRVKQRQKHHLFEPSDVILQAAEMVESGLRKGGEWVGVGEVCGFAKR
jgi:hypothetical protein